MCYQNCGNMSRGERNMTEVLRSVFGYENFKNTVQKDAAMAIEKGSDFVCVSMPPGFGRSLCFQLPAILRKDKVAVIFSPKLSFMKKQIDFLRSKRINARLLSQGTYNNERKVILKDLTSNSPTITLLYSTPEVGLTMYFQNLILSLKQRKLLSYIVFNEAHCLSEWGYEYSPSYKKINSFDKIYGYIPRIAVTTTVTDKVIEDICRALTLGIPKIFKLPVQQIDAHHDVWFLDTLDQPFEHLRNFILDTLGSLDQSVDKMHKSYAIIYCREEVTAELIKNKLNEFGIPALACHYKLNTSNRRNVENKWTSGEASVIITTYDYGFIHNKPIKCVVYWTVPESIAKYYRESAQIRVKDGTVYCRVYFSIQEYSSVKLLIENHRTMKDPEHIKKRLIEYDKLVSYCLSIKCRHATINEYFDHITQSCRSNCDVCQNEEVVETRTLKFITHSDSTEGLTYNICDVNDNPRKKRAKARDRSRSVEILGIECQKLKITCEEMSLGQDNDEERNDETQCRKIVQIGCKKPEIPRKDISVDKVNDKPKSNRRQPKEDLVMDLKRSKTRCKVPEVQCTIPKIACEDICTEDGNSEINNERELEIVFEEGPKKFEFTFKRFVVGKNRDRGIVQCNYKLVTSSKQKPSSSESSSVDALLSARGRVESNAERMVKRTKDNADAIGASKLAITRSLIDKYNLNENAISLDLRGSRTKEATNDQTRRTDVSNEGSESRDICNNLSDDDSIQVVMVKEPTDDQNRRARKRFGSFDACAGDFKSKRRKTEPERISLIDTRLKRYRGTADRVQRVQRVKDDANESVSRTTVEYLMNKYKLNSDLITLEPRTKKDA